MRTLYMRVLVVTLYTIAISGLLGFYIANVHYHLALKPANDAKLSRMAERMRFFAEQYPEAIGDYLHNVASLGYQIYLYDEAGNDIFYGAAFEQTDLAPEAKERVLAGTAYHGVADYPDTPFMSGYFDARLSNTVGVPLAVGDNRYALFVRHDAGVQFDELRVFFMTMLIASIVLSIPYFLLSTRYLVQPIVRLTEATQRIAQGDYRFQLPMNRKDEIGRLASHFYEMSRQLERSDMAKKEFVANVSHEIQSPLASIQGYADALLSEDNDRDRIVHYASVIGQEARHLSALSRQLLLLSSLNHAGDSVEKVKLPIQPQLRQVLQMLEWQLSRKEISVRMRVSEQMHIWGDEVLLVQVWSNLLSNAVKHIPEGRSIDIRAFHEEGNAVVVISDTGDGIPEDRLPFIFDRFYRIDTARVRAEGSTGLGLSIVRKIVQLHGGSIDVTSRGGEGSEFRVRIPDA